MGKKKKLDFPSAEALEGVRPPSANVSEPVVSECAPASVSFGSAPGGAVHPGGRRNSVDSPCSTTAISEAKFQLTPQCVSDSPYFTANCTPPDFCLDPVEHAFNLDDPPLSSRRPISADFRVESLHRSTSLQRQLFSRPSSSESSRSRRKNLRRGSKNDAMVSVDCNDWLSFAVEDDADLSYEYWWSLESDNQWAIQILQADEALRRAKQQDLCQDQTTQALEDTCGFPPLPGRQPCARDEHGPPQVAGAWKGQPTSSSSSRVLESSPSKLTTSIFDASGPEAVAAFQTALEEGSQKLRSVKLCFVGHARAGKTSTLDALADAEFNESQPSTHGVSTCSFSNKLLEAPAEADSLWSKMTSSGSVAELLEQNVAQKVAGILENEDGCIGRCTSGLSISRTQSERSSPEALQMPCKSIERELSRDIQKDRDDARRSTVMQTWDFAGQKEYYDMAHVFLTALGIYAFVFDLSAWLPAVVTKSSPPPELTNALEFWLGALFLHAPEACLIIVGTHDDILPDDSRQDVYKEVQQILEKLLGQMPRRLTMNHKDDLYFFPIGNPRRTEAARASIRHLRTQLNQLVAETVNKSPDIPTRYLHFFHILSTWSRESGSKGLYISYEDLWGMAERIGFSSKEKDLEAFLTLFHGLGQLLYFPGAPCVILDPQWLLDAMANVVNCPRCMQDVEGRPLFSSALRTQGKLVPQLLKEIWNCERFRGHEDILRAFLVHFDLLVHVPGADEHWLVPSLLPDKDPPFTRRHGSAVLFLDFAGMLQKLMPSILARLLCNLRRKLEGLKVFDEKSFYKNYVAFLLTSEHLANYHRFTSELTSEHLTVSLSMETDMMPDFITLEISRAESAPTADDVQAVLNLVVLGIRNLVPKLQCSTKLKCPMCATGDCLDLNEVLRDREGQTVCNSRKIPLNAERLPAFVVEWRKFLNDSRSPSAQEALARTERAEWRVHFLYASPLIAEQQLNVQKEYQAFEKIPGIQTRAEVATIENLRAAPVSDVLHLSCHCQYNPLLQLILEDESGGAKVFGQDDITKLGASFWGRYKLVILLSCKSWAMAGVIGEFVSGHIICCTGTLKDQVALTFCNTFYGALGAGHCIKYCYEQALEQVRHRPDPGLRVQADMFELLTKRDGSTPERAEPWITTNCWPSWSRVDHFMCREPFMRIAARSFNSWHVLVVHGEPGIGKSAFCREFCNHFSAPGRLFSSGAFMLDWCHLISAPGDCGVNRKFLDAFHATLAAWGGKRATTALNASDPWNSIYDSVNSFDACGRWLLVVDSLTVEDIEHGEVINILQRLLNRASQLHVMLAVRTPDPGLQWPDQACDWNAALYSGSLGKASELARIGDKKVVKMPLLPLLRLPAAKLFQYHLQRRLPPTYFSTSAGNSDDPALLLANSAIIQRTRGVPRDIVKEAARFDYDVPSLREHPSLLENEALCSPK